jgi:hypothetical protein
MKAEDFCKWLNGFFEIAQPTSLNITQTNIIKEKLDTVFDHYTEEVPEDMLSKLKGKLAAASTSDAVKQPPKADYIQLEVPPPSGPMYNYMHPYPERDSIDWMDGEKVRC